MPKIPFIAALRTAATAVSLAAAGMAWANNSPAPVFVDEVPFITTPDAVTLAMLNLAQVTRADHVIDLGSGDGRIVITAAKRFGASGLGVEIVPDLVLRSRAAAALAGVAGRVEFREQDLFKTDLSAATVVTLYLLPELNLQLRPRLQALATGTRIVSHDWDMGDWLPDRSLTLAVPEKSIGREKLSRVHLWVVPAAVNGLWCGEPTAQVVSGAGVIAGSAATTSNRPSLQLQQRHQQLSALAGPADALQGLHGALQGDRLNLLQVSADGSAAAASLQARWSRSNGEERLVVGSASGILADWAGRSLKRGTGSVCL